MWRAQDCRVENMNQALCKNIKFLCFTTPWAIDSFSVYGSDIILRFWGYVCEVVFVRVCLRGCVCEGVFVACLCEGVFVRVFATCERVFVRVCLWLVRVFLCGCFCEGVLVRVFFECVFATCEGLFVRVFVRATSWGCVCEGAFFIQCKSSFNAMRTRIRWISICKNIISKRKTKNRTNTHRFAYILNKTVPPVLPNLYELLCCSFTHALCTRSPSDWHGFLLLNVLFMALMDKLLSRSFIFTKCCHSLSHLWNAVTIFHIYEVISKSFFSFHFASF